jgi:hypothetical protein
MNVFNEKAQNTLATLQEGLEDDEGIKIERHNLETLRKDVTDAFYSFNSETNKEFRLYKYIIYLEKRLALIDKELEEQRLLTQMRMRTQELYVQTAFKNYGRVHQEFLQDISSLKDMITGSKKKK